MAALGGYPYFLHCHGSEVRSGLHQPLRRGLARYGLRHAIHVFYVSPELYEHIRPYRPDATLLPNPVDTELFAPGEQLSGRVRVLLAAPLTAVKGPEILYQAVRLLREELPGVEMDVAAFGFGRDLGRYQELLHVPGITSLPPRPHDEMATLFNAYDIILGQTRLGILSLVELEAMACGKPIVCFCDPQLYARDYPEPPPVLSGHTPEAIAEHLRALIADPSFRLERGRLARAWVVRYHGFDPVTRELLSHYEAYLRSRQRVV
jgi:glycosyltransferase involved in cell wall biosynthesis